MKEMGLSARPKRRFVVTTDSDHDNPIAPNLLEQDFTAERPNQKWVGDITYIPTRQSGLYLATVIDLFSRKVVGWSMSDSLSTPLILDALAMVTTTRRPDRDGLIFHSDRGCQYASEDYRTALAAAGITASMSRKACCYDNAVAESFFHSLKVEWVRDGVYETRAAARSSIFTYIEAFYNRSRRHSTLGYLSPDAFEAAAA